MTPFVLKIDAAKYIEFVSFRPVEQLLCFYDTRLVLHLEEKQFVVREDCIKIVLEDTFRLVNEALNNKLQPHCSVTLPFGYMFNRYLHGDRKGIVSDRLYWIGSVSLLWSPPSYVYPLVNVWIYNTPDGEIMLEVSGSHYWHLREPDPNDPRYISYEEYMKDYKVIALIPLPHHTARQWLAQTKFLLDRVMANEEEYLRLRGENMPKDES